MVNIATIHDRIRLLVEKKANNKNTVFAQKLGVSEANIRGYIKGVVPKADVLAKIVSSYEDISPAWLLTGEGSMTKTASDNKKKEEEEWILNNCISSTKPTYAAASTKSSKLAPNAVKQPEGSHEGIPLIPLSAMAGAFTSDIPVMEYECERYVIPAFKGADFLILVKGDSMQPTYHSGDLVACQKIPLSDIFFQWNKTYVLDTDQGPLIKRVRQATTADHVLLVSDNADYAPFELPVTALHAVALVRGIVRLE